MFTEDEKAHIQTLCKDNPDFKHIIQRYEEEGRLMLSQITHEINNPLTLISSTLQLMAKKNPEVADLHYWDQLNTTVRDMVSLLTVLSNYNQCHTLHKSKVDFITLLTELKLRFQPLADSKHTTISLKITNNSRKFITSYSCDYIKMKQVLTNILKNALEAVDASGSVQILLDADKESNQQQYFRISITNNGTPIPKEDISEIFTPFVTSKANGTGLGLPIAKRIIISHGGSIQVSSSESQTSFIILLPFQA